MERDDIEKLIENKIRDARLELSEKRFELSEKRLKFALSLVLGIGALILTVFGVMVPLLVTNQSSDRVDRAIQNMEKRFEQLAGRQLRDPKLELFLDERKKPPNT